MNKQNSDSAVEKLVASATIETSVVAEAAKKNAENQRAQQIQTAQAALDLIRTNVEAQVGRVREARKAERTAVDRLKVLAAAGNEFETTGDLTAFAKALYPTSPADVNYTLQRFPGLSK